MVVSIETGFREASGLVFGNHPQCTTDFHVELVQGSDHFQYLVELGTVFYISPCGAHTNPRASSSLCLEGLHFDLFHAHQPCGLYLRMVSGGLRAISTIFGTTSRFNGY